MKNRDKDYQFIKRYINSCKNGDHIQFCLSLVTLYQKKHGSVDGLYFDAIDKLYQIEKWHNI